jgi:hypothetical protein
MIKSAQSNNGTNVNEYYQWYFGFGNTRHTLHIPLNTIWLHTAIKFRFLNNLHHKHIARNKLNEKSEFMKEILLTGDNIPVHSSENLSLIISSRENSS